MLAFVIHGKRENDVNYQITKSILSLIDDIKIKEIYLPDDMSKPCLGCYNCYNNDEKNCYAYSKLFKIYEYLTEADLLVFSCPTYADNMPGYYKNLFDHLAFMWMNRRPNRIMFSKKALIISTDISCKGKKTVKEISKNLKWWGISNIYTYNNNVRKINSKKMGVISEKMANKIKKCKNNVSLFTKFRYYKSRFFLSKKNEYNYSYWKEEGFLSGKRPW